MIQSEQIAAIKKTLGTLINWMAQSSVSPISLYEAEQLFNMLEGRNGESKSQVRLGKEDS